VGLSACCPLPPACWLRDHATRSRLVACAPAAMRSSGVKAMAGMRAVSEPFAAITSRRMSERMFEPSAGCQTRVVMAAECGRGARRRSEAVVGAKYGPPFRVAGRGCSGSSGGGTGRRWRGTRGTWSACQMWRRWRLTSHNYQWHIFLPAEPMQRAIMNAIWAGNEWRRATRIRSVIEADSGWRRAVRRGATMVGRGDLTGRFP
jgi:hypothetical protein